MAPVFKEINLSVNPLKLGGISGAAFQLRKPALVSTVIDHTSGIVETRAGSSYVTVQVADVLSESSLHDHAWRIVQEALDIRAATHRQAMATYRGEHEYALWFYGSSGYKLVIVDTAHIRWNMAASLSVGTDSPIPPPPSQPIPYHPALRFYRLSQLSEDLFDAFRNAYLALECIVSEVCPPAKREPEPIWLKRVLQGPLAHAVPGGIVIADAIDQIYKFGRLPLFHAKASKLFYMPQGNQRIEIQALLPLLYKLVASILNAHISSQISSGWGQMSQRVVDAGSEVNLAMNEVVYGHGFQRESMPIKMEAIDSPRRFGNIWARVTTPVPRALSALESVVFYFDGNEGISLALPEPISLQQVSTVRIELNQLESNVRAPIPLHPS